MNRTLLIILAFAAACARAQEVGPGPSLDEMGAEPAGNAAETAPAAAAQTAPSPQASEAKTAKRKMTPDEANAWELPPRIARSWIGGGTP